MTKAKPNSKSHKHFDLEDMLFSLPLRLEKVWQDVRTPLFWSVGAVISLGILVAFSVTKEGSIRLAQLPYDMQDIIENKAPGTSLSAILDKQLIDVREEKVQAAAQRVKLEQRLASLEESFGDITASIPQKTDTAQAAATNPPLAASTEPTISGGKGTMTLSSRSQFGIDLGAGSSMGDLRQRWVKVMDKFGGMMAGYEPLISVQDAGTRGVELRLVAGPFADATEAATLCAKLRAAGLSACAPTAYDGQRLALR